MFSRALCQVLLSWAGLPGTNTPAYFLVTFATKKKVFAIPKLSNSLLIFFLCQRRQDLSPGIQNRESMFCHLATATHSG
jgi:hypothetical protein